MKTITQIRKIKAEYAKAWRAKTPNYRDAIRRGEKKLREQTLVAYGGLNPKCACCGEDTEEFLCINHINNNGAKERREYSNRRGGTAFYRFLKKNNFPSGYNVLCYNCNMSRFTRGKCPHER